MITIPEHAKRVLRDNAERLQILKQRLAVLNEPAENNSLKRKSLTINMELELDKKYWEILPCISINRHSKELELRWFCFGVYLNCTR